MPIIQNSPFEIGDSDDDGLSAIISTVPQYGGWGSAALSFAKRYGASVAKTAATGAAKAVGSKALSAVSKKPPPKPTSSSGGGGGGSSKGIPTWAKVGGVLAVLGLGAAALRGGRRRAA